MNNFNNISNSKDQMQPIPSAQPVCEWQEKVPVSPVFNYLKSTFLSKIPCDTLKNFLETKGRGYFLIPATKNHYGKYTHGLLVHSILSYYYALESINALTTSLINPVNNEEKDVMLRSAWLMLVADIYKWNSYRQTEGSVKIDGTWTNQLVWECHDDGFPFGQSEKSVFILREKSVKMNTEAALALRWCRSSMTDVEDRCSLIKASSQNTLVEIFATSKSKAANWKGTPESLVSIINRFEKALSEKTLQEATVAQQEVPVAPPVVVPVAQQEVPVAPPVATVVQQVVPVAPPVVVPVVQQVMPVAPPVVVPVVQQEVPVAPPVVVPVVQQEVPVVPPVATVVQQEMPVVPPVVVPVAQQVVPVAPPVVVPVVQQEMPVVPPAVPVAQQEMPVVPPVVVPVAQQEMPAALPVVENTSDIEFIEDETQDVITAPRLLVENGIAFYEDEAYALPILSLDDVLGFNGPIEIPKNLRTKGFA